MKVLILSGWEFLPPYCGTRRLVYNTASGLSRLGHDVMLLAAASDPGAGRSVNAFRLDFIPVRNIFVDSYSALGRILKGTPQPFWMGASELLRSWILKVSMNERTIQCAASFAPDVILAEDMWIAKAGLHLARTLRVPLAYRIHHFHIVKHARRTLIASAVERLEASVLTQADMLLALTRQDADFAERAYGLRATFSPIAIEDMPPNASASSAETRTGFVLYVSSYLGHEVRWLRALAACLPSSNILFAGRGSEGATSFPKNIIPLGVVPDGDLAVLYRNCAFVFFPLEWMPGQGFPIKLAEAFKSNRPILLNTKASWLLPQNAEGIFRFHAQEDLQITAAQLLAMNHTIQRDCSFLDPGLAATHLAHQLGSLIARERYV